MKSLRQKRDLSLKSTRQRLIGFPPKLKLWRLRWKKKKASPGKLRPQEAKPKVFNPPGTFNSLSFNFKSLAKFIRNGFVNIRSDGPKTHRYVLVNDKREYLPDLVKQIFRDHILPAMDYGSEEGRKEKLDAMANNFDAKKAGMSLGEFCILRRKIRILEEKSFPLKLSIFGKIIKKSLLSVNEVCQGKVGFLSIFFVTFLISGSEKKKSFPRRKIFPLKASRSKMK